MALPRVAFPLVLQSPSTGSALVGASATITKHVVGGALGSGEAATIYTAETGAGKTASNTILTDNTGRWTAGSSEGYKQYWLEEGRYDILISGTGLTSVYITRELVTGYMESITTERLADRAVTAEKIGFFAVTEGTIAPESISPAEIAKPYSFINSTKTLIETKPTNAELHIGFTPGTLALVTVSRIGGTEVTNAVEVGGKVIFETVGNDSHMFPVTGGQRWKFMNEPVAGSATVFTLILI